MDAASILSFLAILCAPQAPGYCSVDSVGHVGLVEVSSHGAAHSSLAGISSW